MSRREPPSAPRPPGESTGRISYRAVLLSALVCPGLGQIALGQPLRGWLLVVTSLLAAAGVAVKVSLDATRLLPRLVADPSPEELVRFWGDLRQASGPVVVGGTVVLAGLWVFSVLDAYRATVSPPADVKPPTGPRC